MEIVGAFACSHAGLILTRADLAPVEAKESLFGAFRRMGDEIQRLRPDAVVMIGTDHGRIFDLTHVPQFTIGVNAIARSIGDADLPAEEVAIHEGYAQSILVGLLEADVDVAYSEAMKIDHSFISPLTLAFAKVRPSIVPIIQNCNSPPLPTLRRSYAFGKALGDAIRSGPQGRIVIMGTGGLSHWVGSERYQNFMREPAGTRITRKPDYPLELTDTGLVNEAFDRDFMRIIAEGRAQEFVSDWSTDRLFEAAGNGGQEIRNWLTVAGAVRNAQAEILAYGAVAEWLTGTAIARFDIRDKAVQ
ncbi:MAG: hypothetical protein EXR27_13385 [Betaproteobacteria bacterium]|nr:hypothetical protein [Betaproteobacteria bacterium]